MKIDVSCLLPHFLAYLFFIKVPLFAWMAHGLQTCLDL